MSNRKLKVGQFFYTLSYDKKVGGKGEITVISTTQENAKKVAKRNRNSGSNFRVLYKSKSTSKKLN